MLRVLDYLKINYNTREQEVVARVKEVAALRERVLKLEHKTNELMDLLTDFRVRQVMGSTVSSDESN